MIFSLRYCQSNRFRLRVISLLVIGAMVLSISPATVSATAAPTAINYEHDKLLALFDYDSSLAVDIQENSVSEKDGINVYDISFAGVDKQRVTAFLLVPAGDGPFAGAVFVHWGFGSRWQFLEEAKLLANSGVVSLLIDLPFADSSAHFIQSIIKIRRAVDVLNSHPRVDQNRLAYIGHSWGATLGGILAGVEKRFAVLVLMAGFPSYAEYTGKPELAQFAGINYVGHTAPSALLFQFARRDAYVSERAAKEFYAAASEPKRILWYDDTSHSFKNQQARMDRVNWLGKWLN